MPLFARGHEVTTRTRLERKIKEIEERSKKENVDKSFEKFADALLSNIEFAKSLNLISLEQEHKYKRRVEKAILERNLLADKLNQKANAKNVINGSAVPGERAAQFMSVDEVQEQIARQRAEQDARRSQSEQKHSTAIISSDEIMGRSK